MGSRLFRDPQAQGSALTALGMLQPRAFGSLKSVEPLDSVSNYYLVHAHTECAVPFFFPFYDPPFPSSLWARFIATPLTDHLTPGWSETLVWDYTGHHTVEVLQALAGEGGTCYTAIHYTNTQTCKTWHGLQQMNYSWWPHSIITSVVPC